MPGSKVYVDTSALVALLIENDHANRVARHALRQLATEGVDLITSSFVVQETSSLLQTQFGLAPVRVLHEQLLPKVSVVWVDHDGYLRAISTLLAANRRRVSLTDWCGFDIMRARSIKRAFAFDRHFEQQGFELIPPPTATS